MAAADSGLNKKRNVAKRRLPEETREGQSRAAPSSARKAAEVLRLHSKVPPSEAEKGAAEAASHKTES